MTGDMSEIVGFLKSGEVRVLAVLTEERVPGFDDIPTAKEQGIDVVAVNWRGLYVPKGISDEQFDAWGAKLAAVAAVRRMERGDGGQRPGPVHQGRRRFPVLGRRRRRLRPRN